MSDVQDRYRLVSSGFDATVRAVSPDQWEAQSPCEEWTARDLVAHVVENHRGVITADPEAAAKEVDGPTGKIPAGQAIGQFMSMDLLVHTWDLARTIGADERLDESSVRLAYETLKPMDAVIRQPNVFGPKLEAPMGADLQTEFLYFLGRQA
jgi:hypothetical protein